MADWSDPRGSTPPTSQARPGVVVALSAGAAPGRVSASITWGKLGEHLIEMGWSVIPQTNGSDGKDRRPGTVIAYKGDPDGGMIRYKKQYELDRRMPDRRIVKMWRQDNKLLNVAGVPGDSPGEFGWFAIDIDILDPKLMSRVLELADRILGRTPFLRGRRSTSKAALIYRRKLGPLRMPQSASGRPKVDYALEATVRDERQAIEIKDAGALITLYGHHHKALEPYIWLRDAEPYTAGPGIAPEVDEEQILDFLGAVHALSPIVDYDKARRDYTRSPVQWADTDVSEVRMPPMSDDMANAVDLKDGRVDWLFKRSTPWARWNAGIVAPLVGAERQVDPDGISLVAAALLEESKSHIDYSITGKQLSSYSAHRIISEKVRSAAEKIARGEPGYEPVGTRRLNPVTLVAEPEIGQGVEQTDDEYSWLPKTKDRKRILDDIYRRTAPDKEAATAIGLIYDRIELMQRVSSDIRTAIMTWLDALWAHRQMVLSDQKITTVPAHLLKAPTGAGKTSMFLKCLGEWRRAHPGADLGPILMLMPSYTNIAEVAGREDLGVWTEDMLDRAADIIAEAEGAGIRTMIFKGKLAAGCLESERMSALQAAGISGSGLCEAEIMQEAEYNGVKIVEKVTRYCRYHPDNPDRDEETPACEAILQQFKIATHDLILAPHAFLTTNIPKALKQVSAVVVDEKIWDKCIGVRIFPLRAFQIGRPEPQTTKKEKKAKVDAIGRVMARDRVGELVIEAAQKRVDISQAIIDANATEDLTDALWVTGRLQRVVMEITPDTSLTSITDYVGSKNTRYLLDEHKAYKLIEERVQQLQGDELLGPARGDHDFRIQMVEDGESLRVSWRRELNFDDKPIMWLDASGNETILKRIWGRDIVVHAVDAPLFVRCVWIPDGSYAKSRILPSGKDNAETRLAKSSRQVLLQEAMTAVSILHGDGGVVSASALEVRKHLQKRWVQPANLHFMHYGNVRGIDFGKSHAAAFSVGQLELRPVDLDAYTGAFTYDLERPEQPSDPFGNGRIGPQEDAELIPRRLVDRNVPLRDGGIATVQIYEPAGEWAAMIVEQIREEELGQFLGRLRPVYRSGRAPTWYHCGRVLPRGVVVDEVVALEDLARPFGRSLPVIHEMGVGGVLTPTTLGGLHLTGVSDTAISKAHATVAGSQRWTRGMYEIEYTVAGSSEPQRGFVPGYAADPLKAIKDAVYDLASARVVREPRVHRFGLPVPDKVDAAIGTREQRAAAYDASMSDIMTRIERAGLAYDEKRRGITVAGRAQAPHLFAAIEAMNARVVELATEAKSAEIDALPAEVFMLDGLDAGAVAKVPEVYDEEIIDAVLERTGRTADRDQVLAHRKKAEPVSITFTGRIDAPAPANGDDPVPALPEGVVRLKPRFGFKPVVTPPAAEEGLRTRSS